MRHPLSPMLAALAAECLELPVDAIDPRLPLARYGLDSLGVVTLTASLERLLGRSLPESLIADYPDLLSLQRFLEAPATDAPAPRSSRELMRLDSRLPDDVTPAARATSAPRMATVLLTGATGFLGGHLLRSLLKVGTRVICLARASGGSSGRERIADTLARLGIGGAAAGTVAVIEGDLRLPSLGLSGPRRAALADEIDAIFHAGADLSWIGSYAALRATNVLGTLELLRLACLGTPKALHFVSSTSVCASTCGPRDVDEGDDMIEYLDGLHLGYAQSKCVAEALVRQAGARGLPITIVRPALIAGSRASGESNVDDLLSRLVKGVILMRAAPDLDWSADCCPVDYVADALVRLAHCGAAQSVYHLISPHPRHWRELVLWMNLFGYRVRLLPYRDWLGRLRAEAAAPGHPLRELLPFFVREPAGEGGLTLPELYEETRRSRVRDPATRGLLRQWPLGDPGLGANLLDRYFRAYIDSGFLPPIRGRRSRVAVERHVGAPLLQRMLRRHTSEPALRVLAAVPEQGGGAHSIIAELTSWRHGSAAGLERYRLVIERGGGVREELGVVVKRKPRDEQVIDVAQRVAAQCSSALGRAFRRFGRELTLAGSDLREVGVYRQRDPRFRRHSPALIGTVSDAVRNGWALVLEDIAGLELLDTVDDVSAWTPGHLEATIRGLARLHAIWFGRERALLRRPWLGPTTSASRHEDMLPLWVALASHAAPRFAAAAGADLPHLQERLLATVGRRRRGLERLPRTLIHNDCNPRNVALRREGNGWRLCAYDWELATIGVPQHDCAEFLCFVLSPDLEESAVRCWVALHREELERATGQAIPAELWERGFRLALHDLLVDRLAMYAMIDRFRPQRFLTRVLATWRALYDLYPMEKEDGL